MRRIVISIMAACCLFVSCNKEFNDVTRVVSDSNESKAIVFGLGGEFASVENKSVTVSTADLVKTNGFTVTAITSEGVTLIDSKAATWKESASNYQTATPYYYPATGTTGFYAVYPSRVIGVVSAAASLSYTNDKNTDLLAAKTTGVSASDNSVALAFAHILSQVCFTAKGSDNAVTYKVTSISLSAPGNGTYAFASNSWTAGTAATSSYLSTTTSVATDKATALGEVQTYLPSEMEATVKWECYSGDSKVAEYSKSTKFTPTMGKKCTVNLTLPNASAKPITFDISVADWGSEDKNVTLN